MSMDSVSRSPWFGLQLKPRKQQPVYQKSISQSDRRREDTAKVQPALAAAPRDSQWPQWLTLPSSRPALPLPRTDTASDEKQLEPTDAPIEF
jgi:hypothetical protein